MFKRLLDFNSPENIWLRENRPAAILIGAGITLLSHAVIGLYVYKSYKKEMS